MRLMKGDDTGGINCYIAMLRRSSKKRVARLIDTSGGMIAAPPVQTAENQIGGFKDVKRFFLLRRLLHTKPRLSI